MHDLRNQKHIARNFLRFLHPSGVASPAERRPPSVPSPISSIVCAHAYYPDMITRGRGSINTLQGDNFNAGASAHHWNERSTTDPQSEFRKICKITVGVIIKKAITMLSNAGLRIERLLYFGLLLIFLCWVETYLSATAAYFADTDNRVMDGLLQRLTKDRSTLERAFDKKAATKDLSDREKRADKLRGEFGLAPRVIEDTDADSYSSCILIDI